MPDIQVSDHDVNTAVLYLRDMGLQYDGLRLHGAFARLRNRCMDEWFASMANGESQEYRDKLIELFGPFPRQGNPNDSVVADRRVATTHTKAARWLKGLVREGVLDVDHTVEANEFRARRYRYRGDVT